VYKDPRKFSKRSKPSSKTTTLQGLHSPYGPIWLPIVVLQQGPFIISSENAGKNAKESSHLDFGGIQNVSVIQY